jgi:hypothetical protein
LASTVAPHLADIADLAHRSLDVLGRRHRHITAVVHRLETAGLRNPSVERERLAAGRAHRSFLRTSGRVRALDWDSVGTVVVIAHTTGTAYVHFQASDGRQAMKWLR